MHVKFIGAEQSASDDIVRDVERSDFDRMCKATVSVDEVDDLIAYLRDDAGANIAVHRFPSRLRIVAEKTLRDRHYGESAMALTFKPKHQQVRMIVSDDPSSSPVVTENPGKVFAVIGPFDGFSDKMELQHMLETLLRGWNVKPSADID